MPKFGNSITFNSKADSKLSSENQIVELEEMFLSLQSPQRVQDVYKNKSYASQIAVCPRKNTINAFFAEESTLTLSGNFYTGLGNCVEKIYVDLLKFNNKLIASSVKITDNPEFVRDFEKDNSLVFNDLEKLNYSGIIDMVVLNDGKIWLLDCKTSGELPIKNSYVYERQLQFYSLILGIDNCGLLYQNRAIRKDFNKELDLTVLSVNCSYEKLLEVAKTAFITKLCIDNEILPNKQEFFKKSVHCKYCNFVNFCYNGENLELYPLVQDDELLAKLEKEAGELAVKFMESRKSRFFQFYEKFLKAI